MTSNLNKISAEVTVVDDDDLPTLTIAAVSLAVTEPAHAQFKILSTINVLNNIDIGITISQSHNVLSLPPG